MILIIFYSLCAYYTCSALSNFSNETMLGYKLVSWREGNDLFFHCQAEYPLNSIGAIFRINESVLIYLDKAESFMNVSNGKLIAKSVLPELKLGLVMFTVVPEFEGTYSCGNPVTNVWSEGVGPVVADPTLVDENNDVNFQVIETMTGENVTILCPVRVGKLEQYYNILWYYSNEEQFHLATKSSKFMISSGEYSTLTVVNVQDKDFTLYKCEVFVQNPATNHSMGNMTKKILLSNTFDWKKSLLQGFIGSGWFFVCSCLLLFSCLSFVGIRLLKDCFQNVTCKAFSSKIGSNCSVNFETSLLEGEVSQFGMEHIHGLQLCKEQHLGTGTFGEVFKSIYKGKLCAAKMLTHHAQIHLMRTNETSLSRNLTMPMFHDKHIFFEELSHSNIVQHIALIVNPTSNLPILVMELMDSNLKSYLENCQPQLLPLFFQLSIFLDIAKGLCFLHSKNIIHCDLCDTNILLNLKLKTPQAKISDYSISSLIPNDIMSSVLYPLGHRKIYYPLAVAVNFAAYTESTDLYALGILGLQIVLTESQTYSYEDMIAKLSTNNLLRDIILTCLQKNDRTSSKEVVDMLISLKQ